MESNAYAPPRTSTAGPATMQDAQTLTLFIHLGLTACAWTLDFPAWAFALILFIDFYVRAPVAVRAMSRVPVRPEYRAFDPSHHQYGAEIAVYLDRVGASLRELGFSILETPFESVAVTGHATSCVAVYENARGERIQVAASYHRAVPEGPLHSTGVLFIRTLFADGTEYVTANSENPGVFPKVSKDRGECFPMVKDPVLLWRIHEKLVAREQTSAVVPFPTGSVATWMADSHEELLKKVAQTGYFWKPDDDPRWVKTWRGALLMSWRLIWPIGNVRRIVIRRKATRLLRELGFPASGEGAVALQMPALQGIPWRLFGYIGFVTLLYAGAQAKRTALSQPLPAFERR